MSATDSLHPLLAERRSPYSIDPQRVVTQGDLRALFEAARWAMSSYNAQPWRYIVANRAVDPGLWQQVFAVLVPGNQAWAQYAPVLALGCVVPEFDYNGKPNKAAEHDLGAASALLTVEAAARGLCVHQMIGIDPEAASTAFELDGKAQPLTALAIGYAGVNPELPADYLEREQAPRQRKPLAELLLGGSLND